MGKVTIKKQQKKLALMQSAYDLFISEGFAKTTIRDIASKAGVAKGTFYLYFKDKGDIREAVIRSTASRLLREACDNLDAYLEKTQEQMDAADMFIYIIDYLIEVVAKDKFLVRFISKHLSWGLIQNSDNHKTFEADDSENADIESFVLAKLEKHNVRVNDIRMLLFTLLELVSSTCHDVILYQIPASLEDYKPYLYSCVRLLVNNAITD